MAYLIRFREVRVHEVEIDAPTYKDAFLEFQRKLEQKQLTPKPESSRLFYDIETITQERTCKK